MHFSSLYVVSFPLNFSIFVCFFTTDFTVDWLLCQNHSFSLQDIWHPTICDSVISNLLVYSFCFWFKLWNWNITTRTKIYIKLQTKLGWKTLVSLILTATKFRKLHLSKLGICSDNWYFRKCTSNVDRLQIRWMTFCIIHTSHCKSY